MSRNYIILFLERVINELGEKGKKEDLESSQEGARDFR